MGEGDRNLRQLRTATSRQDSRRPTEPSTAYLRTLWFSFLGILYIGYVLLYFEIDLGFWDFSIMGLVLSGLLVISPAYIGYLWSKRREVISIDYHMIYVPFVAWYVTFIGVQEFGIVRGFVSGKGTVNAVFESCLVALSLGVYLLRFPIDHRWPWIGARRVASILATMVVLNAILVAYLVPGWRD